MLTSAKSSLCVIYFPLYMYNVSPGNGPLTIVKCKIRLATSSLSLSLSLLNRPNPTVTIFNRSLIRKTQNKTTNCTNLCINIGRIAETILRKEPWHMDPPPLNIIRHILKFLSSICLTGSPSFIVSSCYTRVYLQSELLFYPTLYKEYCRLT